MPDPHGGGSEPAPDAGGPGAAGAQGAAGDSAPQGAAGETGSPGDSAPQGSPGDSAPPGAAGTAAALRRDSAPRRQPLGGWGGCILWAVAFVLVVVIGGLVGSSLRPNPNARFTAERGPGYVLEAYRDPDGARCLTVLVQGKVQAGQCGYGSGGYEVTTLRLSAGRTLVFAPVPDGVACVLLPTPGRPTRVKVRERRGVRWFAWTGRALSDTPVTLLDRRGSEVAPPVAANGG
ncbi:MAG: hypothetical protein HYX34_13030 [Actinobacteria bacterium]|nr:hypothetical protein [Actinomycetota bacterium]